LWPSLRQTLELSVVTLGPSSVELGPSVTTLSSSVCLREGHNR